MLIPSGAIKGKDLYGYVVDVTQNGALPGQDSTAAINQSLATGRPIYIPGGDQPYLISGPLLYQANGQRISGDGATSVLRGADCSGPIVDSNGKVQLALENINLSGQATGTMLKWGGRQSVMRDVNLNFPYQGETPRLIDSALDASGAWSSVFDNVQIAVSHAKNLFESAVKLTGNINGQVWNRLYTSGLTGFETRFGIQVDSSSISSRALTFINPTIQGHKVAIYIPRNYCSVVLDNPYTENTTDYDIWLGGVNEARNIHIRAGTLHKPIYMSNVKSVTMDTAFMFESPEPSIIVRNATGTIRNCRTDQNEDIRNVISQVAGTAELHIEGNGMMTMGGYDIAPPSMQAVARTWPSITEPVLP